MLREYFAPEKIHIKVANIVFVILVQKRFQPLDKWSFIIFSDRTLTYKHYKIACFPLTSYYVTNDWWAVTKMYKYWFK